MNHNVTGNLVTINALVEGPGDVKAIKILLQKYFSTHKIGFQFGDIKSQNGTIDGSACIRWLNTRLRSVKQGSRAIFLILRDAKHPTDPGVKCPVVTTRELAICIQRERYKLPMGVAVAKWEYEAWLIASIKKIAEGLYEANPGSCYLNTGLELKEEPEDILDPKEWIRRKAMTKLSNGKRRDYEETKHQAAMTEHLCFTSASRCASFKRFLDVIEKLTTLNLENGVTPSPNECQQQCCS